MSRFTLFGVLLVALTFVAGDTHPALGTDSCPDGTFVFVASGKCFPIVDMTGSLGLTGTTPPDSVVYSQSGTGVAQAHEAIPEPQGNLWAGTTYERYHLDASEGAVLQTSMIVYPSGLGTNLSPNWIFTTATNRTDYFVEVLVAYSGVDTADLLGYDTSCSRAPAYPCEDPTSPIQVNVPLSDVPCYQSMEQDESGDWNRFLTYNNLGFKADSESPPLWWNIVQLFNYCTQTWDQVYFHEFRADQADCAAEDCAWWGPIIETIPREWDPGTLSVPELGYKNSAIFLFVPSEQGFLKPVSTVFWHPGGSAWQTFDLEPNHTYGVGGFKDGDGDGVPDASDNCPSWPNANQQLPPWSVPVGDSDCDGYPDTVQVENRAPESFIGTDAGRHCAATSVANDELLDSWPPDHDDNQLIDLGDVLKYNLPMGAIGPDPPYSQRLDLNADNIIDLGDVLHYNLIWGMSCVP